MDAHPVGDVDGGEVRIQKFHPLGRRAGDPLDYFNDYVRGTLRDFVRLGRPLG